MTNSKTTKRALISSALAMFMCVAMLIGTTFAWFTDTASTSVNKIQAGTLDVALEVADGKNTDGTTKWVSAEGKTLDFVKAAGHENEAILWEPGCTYSLPQLRIVNNGNLALKYKVVITGIKGDAKLNEVIDWTIGAVALGTEQKLAVGASDEFTISGTMKKSAGNAYQGLSIDGISITVVATQDTVEYDSNDNQYDKGATLPDFWNGKTTTPVAKSEDGKYHITSAAELVWLMDNTQDANSAYIGETLVLDRDINLGGYNVKGIGSEQCNFAGDFDGQGFAISDFVIDSSAATYYGGLFGYLYGATVKNLNVSDATVIGQKQVGILAGCVSDNSIVTNCNVYNSVAIGVKKVGTVAGYTSSSNVTGCYAENCNVYCQNSDESEAGAVIGYVNNDGCTIDNKDAKNVIVTCGITLTGVSTVADLKSALSNGGNYVMLKDINMNNVWTTVKTSNKNLVLEGSNHKITNLNVPLVNFYGGTCTINNLTVADSNVVSSGNNSDDALGIGIILAEAQWANLYMNNCHVKNCKLNVGGSNNRAGSLVGYWIGGGEIKNCTVEDCTVYGVKSAGGVVGHNQVQEGYESTSKVTGCVVKNTLVTSDQYAGMVLGRKSTGVFEINDCTYTGNAYGNIGAGGDCKVIIDGTTYTANN